MGNRRDFVQKILLASFGTTVGFEALSSHLPDFPDKGKSLSPQDWDELRNAFHLHNRRIYMNNATLGPSPKLVVKTVHDAMIAQEEAGETHHGKIKDVRATLAEYIGAKKEEVGVTRNATEASNIIARGLRLKKGDEVILSTHEHVGGASPWMALRENGVKIKLVDLDLSGEKNLDLIKEAISKKTKAVFLSHVCCTTGMVLPIKEIAAYCREREIVTCFDGAQALGHLVLNMSDIQPDFYIASCHKWLMGPKGTGLLYIRKESQPMLTPTFVGAYTTKTFDLNSLEMEYETAASRIEYGTRNTPINLGIQASVAFANAVGPERIQQRCLGLAKGLKTALSSIPQVEILSPMKDEYSSGILTFKLSNIGYQDLQKRLATDHKIRCRGIYENKLNGIRISCGVYNNPKEVKALVQAINKISQE